MIAQRDVVPADMIDELAEAQRLTHIGSWYWDAATDVMIGSLELCRIFGCKEMPPFNQQHGTLFTPEVWQQLSDARQQTLLTGIAYNLELPALRLDNTLLWIVTRGETVRDSKGIFVGLRGTVQDISERKQVEIALGESELRNRLMFEKSAYPAALTKLPEDVLVEVNDEWVKLFGYAREEAIGKTSEELNLHPDLAIREYIIAEIQRVGRVRNLEVSLHNRDGVSCIISANIDLLTLGGEKYSYTTLQDITRHKQAEAETQFRLSLLNAVNHAMIATDLDGVITYLNSAAEKLYGWPVAEAIGSSILDITLPNLSQPQAEEIIGQLGTGKIWSGELQVKHRNGKLFTVSVQNSPIYNASGKYSGIISVSSDISQLIQAKQALDASKKLLEYYMQLIHTGCWDINLLDNTANRTLGHDEIFGYTSLQPQWSFDIFLEHVLEEERAEVEKLYLSAIVAQTDWNIECRIRRVDGKIRWILIAGGHQRDALGTVWRLSGIVKDITEQKQAELQQNNASAYARSLIEASLDPLVTISADGKITDVNDASVQATGVARTQLIGTDFSDYFTEPEMARSGYHQVFSEGLVHNYPLTLRHESGSVMEVLYNAAVYKDEQGRVLGAFAAARDVTERNQLDQILLIKNLELQSAITIAEKASQAKSNFLSSMSHELRTPLNAILGFAQLLESGTPQPTEAQDKRLQQILKAGWYLLELINEILDLSVIESGKLVLQIEPVPLADVIRDCQGMILPQAAKRDIQVTFPPCDDTLFAVADRTRLKQVLVNLLSNAIKYNRKHGTVELTCQALPDEHLRILIKDSGAGLSAEKKQQLFQPFNRLGQESSSEEGTGIGLVVAKHLVELMGGSIGVESTVGVGSEFWVELERAEAPSFVSKKIPSAHHKTNSPGEATQFTLLYVEDNPANLLLVEEILAERPHISMLSANDGEEGVALARKHLPDVILMDVGLPGLSGIDAMKVLRRDPATSHIPIIALSANAMLEDIEKGIAAGFFRYLTKPVKINEMMQALKEGLSLADKNSAYADESEYTHDNRGK